MNKSIIFLLSIIIFSACVNETDNMSVKPNPSGKAGEVLVVISDNAWNSEVGDTIFYSLSEAFPILPQNEPFFTVIHIPKGSFHSIFKTHRNIIFINIGKENPDPKITTVKDKWSKYQLIFNLYAPDEEAMVKLWSENMNSIKKEFFNKDISRYQMALSNTENTVEMSRLQDLFGISMQLPSDFNLPQLTDDFYWVSKETNVTSQGLFIYTYPYVDSSTFSTDYIISKLDEKLKKYVPGPNDGTYMQVEKRVSMQVEQLTLNGNYAYLIRGLWYTENYFLGGPFICLSVLDKKNNRIVTVVGYVYAGKQNKKLYMWQIEAIVKTLKIL